MSTLLQRTRVACPYHLANAGVDEIITALNVSTHPILHLNAPIFGLPMPFSKDVQVTFSQAADPMHFDAPWAVHWEAPQGTFPSFDGTLCVTSDETYTTSIIELRGEYIPPLGLAGQIFDHAVGSRIASATARDLLKGIAREVEARYTQIEHDKHIAT